MAASRVATGDEHSCALLLGSSLYCWGANTSGQLGTGSQVDELRPVRVSGTERYQDVCAGIEHTCALSDQGQVLCWGRNQRGQLGQNNRANLARPTAVPLGAPASVLSCGFEHTCALVGSGELWCWGRNGEGELGLDDVYDDDEENRDALRPVRVGTAAFRAAGAGDGHSCAVQSDGTLWCTGRNTQRQLGPGSTAEQVRRLIRVGTDTDWQQVVAGQNPSCALKTDRSLWCWGTNTGVDNGAGAPLGVPGFEVPTPTRVTTNQWLAVATHTFHTCAIALDGELWCWGRNAEGQLGSADTAVRDTPTRMGRRVTSVDVGAFTTCIVDTSGAVACSGENESGELGIGNLVRPYALTEVVIAAE
jgi:alpha-tubulin suppressor-like RCC1 family protein